MTNIRVPTQIKNITIGGENQPGELYGFINEGNTTTISGGYITASGINLHLTGTASTSSTVADGEAVSYTATVTPTIGGRRLIGTLYTSVYQDSVAGANLIPSGSNITPGDWELVLWLDWGNTDDNNIVQKAYIYNKSGSSHDIYVGTNARYIVNAGSI